jgi:hypothetical protein
MAYLLATVAQFKTFQKGDIPSSLDTMITQILGGLTTSFAVHCRRQTWDKTTFTEYFSWRQPVQRLTLLSVPNPTSRTGNAFYVKNPPIDTGAAYTLYDDPQRAFGASTLIASTDSVVEADSGRVELANGESFLPGLQSTKFSYTGGFLTADGSSAHWKFADLQLLLLTQAAHLYQRRLELGASGRALEGGSISLYAPINYLPLVSQGLFQYRLKRIG